MRLCDIIDIKSAFMERTDLSEEEIQTIIDDIPTAFDGDEEIQERKKNKLATEIVELFEGLLDRKGIEIPCDDKDEQKDRYEGNNTAKLYGMEYFNLVSDIQNLL